MLAFCIAVLALGVVAIADGFVDVVTFIEHRRQKR